MENKKIGILLVSISMMFFLFLAFSWNMFYQQDANEGILSFMHIGFGFFGFIFGLGFYLIFFNKTSETIMKRLESDRDKLIEDDKFNIIFNIMDDFEKRVLLNIKENSGITQSTLQIKSDMSKAKLSYLLQDFEKRNIIKRISKGRSFSVFLKI